jgi:hypothetical protein
MIDLWCMIYLLNVVLYPTTYFSLAIDRAAAKPHKREPNRILAMANLAHVASG